jgi:hypothetical protein
VHTAHRLVTVDVDTHMCLSETWNQEFLVNMTLEQFTVIDEVISPVCVGEIVPPHIQVILPARFRVNTALEWVNPFAAHVWVNYDAVLNACIQVNPCIPMNVVLKWMDTCVQVNYTFQWINELMAQLPVNVSALTPVIVKLVCFEDDVNVRKNKLCDTMCLCHHYTMYSYHYNLPTFTESQDTLWRAPTARYEVVDYPVFVFHPRQHQLNFGETLKSYAYYLLQYRLVWVVEFVIHWCSHLCQFVLRNMVLLVNFDSTPQQHCRNAYLTICQSQYYKHDFAVILSGLNVTTNIVAANFVRYSENMFCKLFWHKYNHATFGLVNSKSIPNSKSNSNDKSHNCFTFLEINSHRKIGGGHHKISVEKIEMQLVSPYILAAPDGYSDFTMCEFIEHLEMSKALTQYDNSIYAVCDVPLNLLVNCLFRENRILIGQLHNIPIAKKMTKSEITEKFNFHDESCEHQYVSVFRPYNKMTNTKRCQKYREMQKPLVEKDEPTEKSTNQDFPPTPPDTLLRRKIVDGFCKATAPAKFEEAGCAVCGSLTLQTELFKLNSLDIDLSVLNTTGQGFTKKERKCSTDPITELDGNVIDTSCEHICVYCEKKIRCGKIPKFALARGLWLGEIPEELQQLSFAEKLLIGRVRHN